MNNLPYFGPGQGLPEQNQGHGVPGAGLPPAPWQTPPQQTPPPKKPNVSLIVLIAIIVVSLGGAAVLAFPQLGRFLPSPSQNPSTTVPAAKAPSYVNGAKKEWTLNLRKEFPEMKNPLFFFDGHLDDASEHFRYGVVPHDGVWVISIGDLREDSAGYLADYVIGIDASSGKIKWKIRGKSLVCQPSPGKDTFACIIDGYVTFVNIHTGVTQRSVYVSNKSYLATNQDWVVAVDAEASKAYGLNSDSKPKWETSLVSHNDLSLGIPMYISGPRVYVRFIDVSYSLDLSSGKSTKLADSDFQDVERQWDPNINPGSVDIRGDDGLIEIRDGTSSSVLAKTKMTNWIPMHKQPGRLVLMHAEPNPTGHPLIYEIASYAPVAPGEPSDFQVVGAPSTQQAPAVIPSCPSGSIHLAYAVFADDWWVLACGIDAEHPTSWVANVQGRRVESSTVRYEVSAKRYAATLSDGGTAWLASAPGMAGVADAQGRITASRSGGIVVFVTSPSKTTPGANTGAYGVPVPADTDVDQVRYLDQILAKSAEGRAKLQPAVVAVRECSHGRGGDYSSEVALIASVTQNRKDLLAALQTAPVDKVPDGVALVNELTIALRHSQSADEVYEAWARAVHSSGCGSGSEAAATEYSKQATAAKVIFVDHWNSTIVPKYGVAAQDQGKL